MIITFKKMASGAAVALALALASPFGISAASAAEDQPVGDPTKIAELKQRMSDESVPTGNQSHLSFASSGGMTTQADRNDSGQLYSSGGADISPAGVPGTLYAYFNSQVDMGFGTTTVEGSSAGEWLGSTPATADSLTLTDKIWGTGVGVSASVGPISGSSTSGGTFTYTTSGSNTAALFHHYSGVNYSGAVVNMAQNATVSAQFGGLGYSHEQN